jgi:rare lipoprotein A
VLIISALSLLWACTTSGVGRNAQQGNQKTRESLRKDRNEIGTNYVIYGKASYYAEKFHGNPTASGEIFDMNGLTAAHKTLPFGTICRVTNLENNKQVIIKINDRGPFIENRILDLSKGAALKLDSIKSGVIEVKIEILSKPEE